LSHDAIASSRETLKSGCQILVDIPTVTAALDNTRLVHLGCRVETLIDNPHITTATEAEKAFWQHEQWQDKLRKITNNTVLLVGYAPSVLLELCEAIESREIQPKLVIGMPVGFSHAPAAKRKLMHSGVPFITIEGTLGGGLLAATALNALVESLIEKPDCHCYLKRL
jgi:precorrin-8X/cobalt-precorrin-8 methylmutase